MADFVEVYWVAPCTDQEYLDAALRVEKATSFPIVSFKFGDTTLKPGELATRPELAQTFAMKARVFAEFSFRFIGGDGPTINIHRNHPDPQGHTTFFDRIQVSAPNFPMDKKALLSAATQSHIGVASVDYIGNLLGPGAKAQFEAREIALTRLEKLVADMAYKMEEERQRREQVALEQQRVLELHYRSKEKELDDKADERSKAQDARDERLNSFKQTLDDASAKDKRRKDFQAIKLKFGEWATTYTVTEGTKAERKTVYWSIVVILAIFFLVALALTVSLVWLPENIYLTVSRATAWILFVSTALYFIRWNNAWFTRLANEEFRLKRLELDVDRANWMIETASEWKEDEKELPLELLSRMSANLFVDGAQEDPVEHTGETLAKAIANASQIKLGPAGTEVSWGKRELNRPT